MALRSAESIEINGRSLESLLVEHAEWLADAATDVKAVSPVRLHGADLRGVDLHGADLLGRDLRRCDLAGADLRGAELSNVDFRDAVLTGANLRNEVDSNTEIEGARFGGADLTIASLPTTALKNAERRARQAAMGFRIWASVVASATLAATVAVLLTRDAALFVDSAAIAGVAWSTYYAAAPIVLGVVMGLFLRFGVRPLILAARELPAILQNGKELGSRTELWPANLLIAPSMPRLSSEPRDRFFAINRAGALFGIWAVIPVVALAHWVRYLPRHAAEITGSQLAVICILAGAALMDLYRTKVVRESTRKLQPLAAAALVGCLLVPVSFAVFEGWIPPRLEIAFQDLRAATGTLRARDFRAIEISYSDLRQLDLSAANLRESRILFSDLSDVDFGGADLSGATLYGSNLDGATFDEADLSGVDLGCAKLLSAEALRNAKVDETTILPDGKPGPLGDRFGLILPDRMNCRAWEPQP